MRDKTINYDQMEWQKAIGYPTGTKIKTLHDKNGAKTFILKIPAGFYMDEHCHTAAEQHFVLEGEYRINKKTFSKGFYRYIPGEVTHGPFTSDKGAIILVIWDPK